MNKKEKKINEEVSLVSKIKQMYQNASDSKAPFIDKWKESYSAYTGELFKRNTSRKSAGQAIPNHIFSTVETIKPIMFTNPPKSVVYPTSEDGFEKAMMVQEALEYEWKRTRLLPKILDSLTNGLIYGTFIIGLFWNAKKDKVGQIEPTIISPFNFFIDPMANEIEDAEYCGYATYKPLGELIKNYPDKAVELRRNATNVLDEELTFGKKTDNVKDNLLYIECYFKDYSTIANIEKDEETGDKYEVTKLKYPNGRKVIIAGDVLIYDGENPYKSGRFPFFSWSCYKIPGQFWGMSEVEVLTTIQKEICNLYNDVIDNAHLNGNAPWIIDKNSGVEKNSLTNDKGLVVRKNPGTEVRRENPPSMPAYIQNIINDLKYDVQVVSGVFDATRGERPASISSGVAIQALQDSSQGRIRLKTQNLEILLTELGSTWVKYMQQFWVTQRTIRIMGGAYEADSRPVIIDGKPVQFREIDKDLIDGDFDLEIKTGSTMAVNRSARFEQILRMAQTPAEDGMPLVDRKIVLEYSDLENVDDIIKRFDEQAQLQAQQAEAQQQMQANLQMQQQQLAHQQSIENMQMNSQAQMEAKQLDIEGKMALQKQSNELQSNIGNIDLDNMSIEEFIAYIQTLSEEELKELIKAQPEVLTVLTQLQKLIAE